MPTGSVAVMSGHLAIAEARPESVLKKNCDCCGQITMGGMVLRPAPCRTTVPVNVQDAELLEESTAVNVKKVTPKST